MWAAARPRRAADLSPMRPWKVCRALARQPGWRAPYADGLESASDAEEEVVAVRASGDGEADRHADIAHRAHGDRDRGDPEVPDREVPVGDPHPVSPSEVRRDRVAVHVRGPHVRDRGED